MSSTKMRSRVLDLAAGAAMLATATAVLYLGQVRVNTVQTSLDRQTDEIAAEELALEFERTRLVGRTAERERLRARLEALKADIAQKRASMARFGAGVLAKDELRDRASRLQSDSRRLQAEIEGFQGSVNELEGELEAAGKASAELAAHQGKAEITDEATKELTSQYEDITAEHKRLQARCDEVTEERRKQSDAQLAAMRAQAEEHKRRAQEPTP